MIEIIDLLKPKNGGSFKLIEAIDVSVNGYTSLADCVSHMATTAMIEAINAVLSGKQDKLTTAQLTAVNSGITSELVTQIGTNTTAIAGKASQADLTALQTTVNSKADASALTTATADLQAQIDALVTPVTQDAEVQNARVDSSGVTHASLKARLDSTDTKVQSQITDANTDITNIGIKLKDTNSVLIQYGYINASGKLKTGTEGYTKFYYTDYISLANITAISVYTCLKDCYIAWYDESQEFISSYGNIAGNNPDTYNLQVPSGAKYVRISDYAYTNPNYTDFLIKYTYDMLDAILEVQRDIAHDSSVIAQFENGVTPEMTTFITGGQLDPTGNIATEEDYTTDAYINSSGNIETNAHTSKYCVTGYMEVLPNTNYVAMAFEEQLVSTYAVNTYNSSKELITSIQESAGKFTTDANCKYIKVCLHGAESCPAIGTGILVVKQGTEYPSDYEAPNYIPYRIQGSDYVTEDEISGLVTESAVKLTLPDQFELVVGDKFELFWKGAVNCLNPDDYYIEVVCTKGTPYRRNFEYTPAAADVGTIAMTVQLFNQDRRKLDEKTVSLIVKAKATNPVSEKVVMYVSDSLAHDGYVPDEFNRRIVTVDGCSNITFIGNRTSVNNSIKYVGNGGWTWASYNSSMRTNAYMWITTVHDKTDADQHSIYKDSNNVEWKLETIDTSQIKIIRVSASGTLPATGTLTWISGGSNHSDIVYTASEQASGNPFWNDSTDQFDMQNFVESQNESSLDYIYILLGWNSTTAGESLLKNQVNTFVNNVLSDYPNCQIVLLGLEVPAYDGLAENYGAHSNVLSNYYNSMNHVWNLNKWYSDIAATNPNVTFVNVAAQFDTEYNMQTGQRNANARNNTKITYQRNGVHPAESGYYQIADACYRDFTHKLQA